jgi:hypothetical protein
MQFDELKNKAMDLIGGHKDQITDGVDKAAELAKDKLGHEDQVDKAADFVKDKLSE